MILAGDLGGTKCTLVLFDSSASELRPICRLNIPTRSSSGIAGILERFKDYAAEKAIQSQGNITRAAFGVAGTLVGDEVLSGNMP